MIATHDSLTAYPVKSWWLRPLNFLCRCQDKTLWEQYHAGARSFDLRFAKWRGLWYAAHGAMLYDVTLERLVLELVWLRQSAFEPFYFRILCEDTFFRKSNARELLEDFEQLAEMYGLFADSAVFQVKAHPLYVRSKCTWETVKEYPANARCADYNVCWDRPFTFKGMENAKSELYHLKTTDDRINFIGCYSSKFIPRLTAKILTPFAKAMKWKENDCPVVDFIQ
jgi:hypothetical protein